jgi:hypothetical protein
MPRWAENTNFPKIITVLAITFGVALGLCGITAILPRVRLGSPALGALLGILGLAELAVMALSGIGMVVVTVVWMMASIFGAATRKGHEPVRLFDPRDTNSSDSEDEK